MKRIKIVKVFAEKVKSTLFLKNPLGSRKPLLNQSDVQEFADGKVEKGFEAIKGDVGFGDVSNMFWYVTALIRHIYDRGVAEFSPYEAYKAGAVVSYDGKLWITHRDVEPSIVIKESDPDPCNCCQTTMVEDGYPRYPSKDTGWCYLVDSCELQDHIDRLEEKDKAIIKMIEDLESIKDFTLEKVKDVDSLVITTSNGNKLSVSVDAIRKVLIPKAAGKGLTAEDGVLNVNPVDFVDGKTVSVNADGKIGIDSDWIDHNIKEPLKDVNDKFTDLETNGLRVFANKPIKGEGTRANPLSLAINERDFEVNPATGELTLKSVRNQAITNLNAGTGVFGFSTFFGNVHKANNIYVTGVPSDVESTEATATATTQVSELKDGQAYDFNGWQFASPVQVDQYLVGTDKAVWHRVNDGGMNSDGTLKEPSNWSVWHRETNVNVSIPMIEALQKRVDTFEARLAALENILAGFVPLKDASGTVQIGLIKP